MKCPQKSFVSNFLGALHIDRGILFIVINKCNKHAKIDKFKHNTIKIYVLRVFFTENFERIKKYSIFAVSIRN